MFSRCLQQAGYAFTSPGHSFYHWEAKSFDPGPQHSQLLEKIFHDASSGAAQDIPLVIDLHCLTHANHCYAQLTIPPVMNWQRLQNVCSSSAEVPQVIYAKISEATATVCENHYQIEVPWTLCLYMACLYLISFLQHKGRLLCQHFGNQQICMWCRV